MLYEKTKSDPIHADQIAQTVGIANVALPRGGPRKPSVMRRISMIDQFFGFVKCYPGTLEGFYTPFSFREICSPRKDTLLPPYSIVDPSPTVGDGSPVPIAHAVGDLFFAERKTAAGASPRPTSRRSINVGRGHALAVAAHRAASLPPPYGPVGGLAHIRS